MPHGINLSQPRPQGCRPSFCAQSVARYAPILILIIDRAVVTSILNGGTNIGVLHAQDAVDTAISRVHSIATDNALLLTVYLVG